MSMKDIKWSTPPWQAGIIGPANSGKSTLIAAVSTPNLLVIDADNRFPSVEGLSDGKTQYIKGASLTSPLALYQDIVDAVRKNQSLKTIVYDSVSKLYQFHSRPASMAGRAPDSIRKEMYGSTNKFATMVDKADIISVLTNLAILGLDSFYVWHTGQGVDVGGRMDERGKKVHDMIEKQSVSNIELSRLETAINIRLRLGSDNFGHFALVEYARDHNGRKANTGIKIYDKEDNYWRGMRERIERLVYTSFKSPEEATIWLSKALDIDASDASGVYDNIKSDNRPGSAAEMWAAVVGFVLDREDGKSESPPQKPEPVKQVAVLSGVPEQKTVADQSPPNGPVNGAFANMSHAIGWLQKETGCDHQKASEIYEKIKQEAKPAKPTDMWTAVIAYVDNFKEALAVPVQPTLIDQGEPEEDSTKSSDAYFEENFPPQPSNKAQETAVNPSDLKYLDGTAVDESDVRDFHIYKKKFRGHIPLNVATLRNAVKISTEGNNWVEEEGE